MAQIQPSGKPDEIARQGCNILTSIMDCKNTLSGNCLTNEVTNMFNQQMESMKANLKQIPGWDEDKCPAAKAGSGVAFVSMSLISLVVARMVLWSVIKDLLPSLNQL